MAEVKKRLCLCLILIMVAAFIGGIIFLKNNSSKEQKKMRGTLVLVERVTEWR